MRRVLFAICVLGALGALVACGGGGGGSASSPVVPTTSGAGSNNKAASIGIKMSIPKPSSQSATRRPSLISPNTASISIVVTSVNGVPPNPAPTPLTFALTNTTYCTPAGASYTCTINFPTPIAAAVVITISTLDANGVVLGSGTITVNTTLATIPVQSVSLGGAIGSIVLSPNTLSPLDNGTSSTQTFTVTAYDPDGNPLIAPATYTSPIVLTVGGGAHGMASVNPATISAPGPNNGATTVTLTYDDTNGSVTAPFPVTATVGNVQASISIAPTTTGSGSLTVPQIAYFHNSGGGSTDILGEITSEAQTQTIAYVDQTSQQVFTFSTANLIAHTGCTASAIGYTCPQYGWTNITDPGVIWGGLAVDSTGNAWVSAPENVNSSDNGELFQLSACSSSSAPLPAGIVPGDSCTTQSWTASVEAAPSGPSGGIGAGDVKFGPDGNLYLTINFFGSGYRGIAFAPLTNQFTYTPIAGQPAQLGIGTDRYMWFTESNVPTVGEVKCVVPVTGCTVYEYGGFNNGANAGAAMSGIVAGNDGYMYALEPRASEIARFQAANCSGTACTVITQVATPTAGAGPASAALGSDGNIYFTESVAGKIGKLITSTCSTACKIVETSIPAGYGVPTGITAGPDGNIWFTLSSGTASLGEVEIAQ